MEVLIAIIGSGAVATLLTYILTRKEKKMEGTLSRFDIGEKLDQLIEEKAAADSKVAAQEEIIGLEARQEASDKLMIDVVREQGRSEEREKQAQAHVVECEKRLAALEERHSILDDLRHLAGGNAPTPTSDC